MIKQEIPTLWPVIDGPAKGQHFAMLHGAEVLYVVPPPEPRNEPMRKVRYELRELRTGGYVWTSEPAPVATRRGPLVISPAPGSRQHWFESELIARSGIKVGALAIHSDGTGYVNPHIQWLWENHCE